MEKEEKKKVLESLGFVRLPEDEGVYGYFLMAESAMSISDDELASITTETDLHKRLSVSLSLMAKNFSGGIMQKLILLNELLKDRIQIIKVSK